MATPTVPTGRRYTTVLVADDESDMLSLMRLCLTDEGYHVLTAASVDQALDLLRAFRVQLVLTDAFRAWSDPDPWTNLNRVLAQAHDTPVIIFSAHRPQLFADFRERGFAGVIAKPFDLDAMNDTIRQTIGNARAVPSQDSLGQSR